MRAVLAEAEAAGFERITRTTGADRVIRLGREAPWLTLHDDGHEATRLARAISRAAAVPVLEAACEASAIVSLALHEAGRCVGAWGAGRRAPASRRVAPLLARGTPAELAEDFAQGLRQVFPETALAVAAARFGIDVARMLGERDPRGTTLALRRKTPLWAPRFRAGEASLGASWGSNQAWGPRHLVFEGEVHLHRLHVASRGGPGRGLAIRFGGSALAQGHVALVSCAQASLALTPDGPCAWRDPRAVIPAGLVEEPDTFTMGRREAERAYAVRRGLEWYVDVTYRGLRRGDCALWAEVESGGVTSRSAVELAVLWPPWRPSVVAPRTDAYTLFAMHRSEHLSAHITLRGGLAEAWAWARPRVETWAAAQGDRQLRVARAHEVLRSEENARGATPLDEVAALLPDACTPFQVDGASYRFGTFAYAPHRPRAGDALVVQLVLSSFDPEGVHAAALADLEALCDEAIRDGVAHSALLEMNQHRPDDKTHWERVAVPGGDDPLKVAAWHASHVRGVDRHLWLSTPLASHIDHAALPAHVAVTDLGRGVRLKVRDGIPRAALEPLVVALGALVPTQQEVERWEAARGAPHGR